MASIDLKEFVGKTIGEIAETLNCNIKLGAKEGTAFVYCGNPSETPIDYEAIENYSDAFFDSLVRRKHDYILDSIAASPTPGAYVESFYEARSTRKITTMGYLKKLERYFDKMHEHICLLKKYEDWNANKPELKDRKIVDAFVSVDSSEPNGTIIFMFEGYERGRYWSTDEAINGAPDEEEEE